MNTLAKYVDLRGITHDELAEMLDCARSHATKMLRGAAHPSPRMMVRIELATDGMVPVSSWFTGLMEEERERMGEAA